MTTTCTFACRREKWRQWISGAPRRCSTMFLSALGRKMHHQSFYPPVLLSVPVQLPAPASQQCLGDSGTISNARVSVLQPVGFGDTSVDAVETEPHLEALTQHVAGRLAVPGVSAAAEVKVLMDSGSGTTAMSEDLVGVLRRQPGMMPTALTQALLGMRVW